jgi:hypothetical protein
MAACSVGQTRCFGNSFERCSNDLLGWQVVEQCADNETCSLDGCQSQACSPGAFRCNDVYLEQCTDAGWQRQNRCATRALCNAENGVCDQPMCGGTLGDFNCLGQSLQKCLPDRTKYDDFRYCATEGLTCDATTGTCK